VVPLRGRVRRIGAEMLCGLASVTVFLLFWEAASAPNAWRLTEVIPPPSAVLQRWFELLWSADYWLSWVVTSTRVLVGFFAAVVLGVVVGLSMAVNRTIYALTFPTFEVLRPIPPLAWVPASIIFWPTQELSIMFVIFLGAFTTMVINVLGGARAIDVRYYQAARSMGSSAPDLFRRITFPGTVPSILVGAEVGMGITWAIVVAGEMIAGGGTSISGGAGGLGYFIWISYVGSSFPDIIVGMFSIGIGGFVSSAAIRWIGRFATPYLQKR
jgi:NitT/TauT family transport system permease protein